jgi:SHS2 domain-containing protein
MYETFEHTADLGLRIRAAGPAALFEDAARALFSIIVTNLDDVRPIDTRHFELSAASLDYLLFDWLNELLFTFDSQRLLLCEFHVRLAENNLQADARGELLDLDRHTLEHEVKAITYHGLRLEQTPDGWLAEVIVDI